MSTTTNKVSYFKYDRTSVTKCLISDMSVSRRSQQDLIYVTTGITQPLLSKCTILSSTVFFNSNCKYINSNLSFIILCGVFDVRDRR